MGRNLPRAVSLGHHRHRHAGILIFLGNDPALTAQIIQRAELIKGHQQPQLLFRAPKLRGNGLQQPIHVFPGFC